MKEELQFRAQFIAEFRVNTNLFKIGATVCVNKTASPTLLQTFGLGFERSIGVYVSIRVDRSSFS